MPSSQQSLPFLPKSKRAQRTVAIAAVALIAASAFYAGMSATRVEASAAEFVAKYQYVDQRPYRATR